MQRDLPGHWNLELDASFSRRDTDDGYIIFQRSDIEIMAVVYMGFSLDAEEAVRSYLDRPGSDPFDPRFVLRSNGITGEGYLTTFRGRPEVVAAAAAFGRLARLVFRLEHLGLVENTVPIWRTLRLDPPRWVEMCRQADPPLAELREALEDGRPIRQTAEALSDRRQIVPARAAALEAMSSDSPITRGAACEFFGYLRIGDEAVMAALRARLSDASVEVRARAAEVLPLLGEPGESVVPAMVEVLQRKEPPLPLGDDRVYGPCANLLMPERYYAARALSLLGAAARPARDTLLALQWDESGYVRLRVAEALLNLGEPLSSILPPLVAGLHDENLSARERMQLVKLLLKYGVPKEQLLPVVRAVFDSTTDDTARSEALRLLKTINEPA